jgi:putative ABC transport system permease protein
MMTLDQSLNYWSYDLDITFEKHYRAVEIERVATTVAGVASIETWGDKSINRVRPDGRESDTITMFGLPAMTQMLRPTLLQGRWLQPEDTDAVVINSDLLQAEPDLKVGGRIVLKLESRETSWQIVGVVQSTIIGSYVYTNYPYYAMVAHEVGKAGRAQIITDTRNPKEQLTIADTLSERFERAGLKISQVRPVTELRSTIKFAFDFLISFLLVMSVVLAIVGGLGLSGTMSINVLERVREIGVMRAIGASDWAVLQLVIVEGLIIGLLSWLLGIMLALPLSKIISDQVGLQLLQDPLKYRFSTSGTIIWLVAAMLLAMTASFLPARSASQLTVREVLAYE